MNSRFFSWKGEKVCRLGLQIGPRVILSFLLNRFVYSFPRVLKEGKTQIKRSFLNNFGLFLDLGRFKAPQGEIREKKESLTNAHVFLSVILKFSVHHWVFERPFRTLDQRLATTFFLSSKVHLDPPSLVYPRHLSLHCQYWMLFRLLPGFLAKLNFVLPPSSRTLSDKCIFCEDFSRMLSERRYRNSKGTKLARFSSRVGSVFSSRKLLGLWRTNTYRCSS